MDIYSFVDEMPEYPEGQLELLKFITNNLKYPEQEMFQGTITCSFVVNKEGHLIDIKIYNKNKEDYTPLDKEALRVLGLMPKWKVGKLNGEKVPVRVYLPIKL
jgi:Periplasmic protein TonB, links inner and outer membranes